MVLEGGACGQKDVMVTANFADQLEMLDICAVLEAANACHHRRASAGCVRGGADE